MSEGPWREAAGAAPAALFRALADPTRRALLEELAHGPASAGQLSRRLGVARVNVSHHLSVLAEARLVDLRARQAAVRPEALTQLRRYFDLALTTAAINLPNGHLSVAQETQK